MGGWEIDGEQDTFFTILCFCCLSRNPLEIKSQFSHFLEGQRGKVIGLMREEKANQSQDLGLLFHINDCNTLLLCLSRLGALKVIFLLIPSKFDQNRKSSKRTRRALPSTQKDLLLSLCGGICMNWDLNKLPKGHQEPGFFRGSRLISQLPPAH